MKKVIHGDLKAVGLLDIMFSFGLNESSYIQRKTNVLIEDSGSAVLCDFGLSRIQNDISSRSTRTGREVIGSIYRMAPERIMGGEFSLFISSGGRGGFLIHLLGKQGR
jgi:Protein kinase domain.